MGLQGAFLSEIVSGGRLLEGASSGLRSGIL